MKIIALKTLAALSIAALLMASDRADAGVNFVAPGVVGSVTNLTVGSAVYDVTFVGNVSHISWASQLDFGTEADAQAAIVALAAQLNGAAAVTLRFTTTSGTFDFTTGQLWYAADATTLYGETLIKSGSNWQLANPFAGGATAPLNNAFPLAIDFTLVSPPAWTNLGSGLAGVSGIPQLAGTGTLAAGSAGTLTLTSARPSAPAMLFVSLASTPVPLYGGVLLAFPVALTVPLTTNAAGMVQIPFTWPSGVPSGTSIYCQYAIQDAAAVKGVSLSNALRGVTP